MDFVSCSSTSMRTCRYDVFISFRGPETRNTFVDHLYNHLVKKGIFAFKDDQRLEKGEPISLQLLQAIKDSRVSVVVFSRDYASSTWCLDELAAIAECHEELKQTVFPVFYDVDPSHVRKQDGVYHDAFVLHTQKFKYDPDKVDRWKRAMRTLAGSAGWDVRNKPEFAEIEKIVQAVIKTLGHKFSTFTNGLVGIQPHIEEIENLLKLSSEEEDVFRVLGIWGMGGIGKTTHATVLFDRISHHFDARCFIEDVNKIYRDGGAAAIHKQILSQTLDENNLDRYSNYEISGIIRNRLHCNIKVLLVFDNVDQLEQMQESAINPKFLGKGSRIIITTRDEHILRVYGADKVYHVPLLSSYDASELFCRTAFKMEKQSSSSSSSSSSSNYDELIPEVLKYAQGLPLAIRVVASFLCARDATQWRDALDRLQNNPDNKIVDVLQISVDGLQHEEKEIFLHIACFFKGEREDYVKRILYACGLHAHIGIQRILEKSLITIRNQEIHMHEMLQELGKKIVRHQFPADPGLWTRIWQFRDFYQVLNTEAGTNNVKAVVLDQKENISNCRAEGLSNMRNLNLLILYDGKFSGSLNFLPNTLRYLLWHGYPFPSLPSNFEPSYLVELNIPDSSIERLWEGHKDLPYLKRMDLSNSKYLLETPQFFQTPNLERLDLTGCAKLLQVHPSIGLLTKLAFLSLQNCSSLVSLSFSNKSKLSSLKVLRLSGCMNLENSPDFTRAKNLEYLDMDRCTSLHTVHESIGALAKLIFLSLRDCTNLVSMPNSLNNMTSLITLELCKCSKFMNLPLTETSNHSSYLKSLIFLDLSFCNLRELPDALGDLWILERLNLEGNNFVSLPSTMKKLYSLSYLNMGHCHELQYLPKLPLISASSVGRYFKTASESRDHRSGLYIFDCPNVFDDLSVDKSLAYCNYYTFKWLRRMVKEPLHFRCGLDIVIPSRIHIIPEWFDHQFDGGAIIRIEHFDVSESWIGFAFCVAFEVNNDTATFGSPHHLFSTPLPHPFYLSFENEHTEERFDFPLSLELDKIGGSKHLWVIYITRKHCHFAKTGACVAFKACPGLIIKKWGLRMLQQDMKYLSLFSANSIVIDNVEESNINFEGPKIQLPFNWLVSDEDEVENNEATGKENYLSNLGL